MYSSVEPKRVCANKCDVCTKREDGSEGAARAAPATVARRSHARAEKILQNERNGSRTRFGPCSRAFPVVDYGNVNRGQGRWKAHTCMRKSYKYLVPVRYIHPDYCGT